MKKLLTLVSVFAIGLGAFAQEATSSVNSKSLRFGIKASPTIGWFTSKANDLEPDGSSVGFSYGLMADFSIGDTYAFATGLDISHKGGTVVYTDLKSNFKDSVKLNYTDSTITGPYKKTVSYKIQQLEIPLTIKMRTKEIGFLTYFAQVGVAPSISIGAKSDNLKYEIKDGTAGNELYKDEDIKDYLKAVNNFGVSMIIGAGVEYGISGDTRLVAGLTFNNGFTDILSENKDEFENDFNEDARANFVALNIGLFF